MISKIAGFQDFHRITEGKKTDALLKDTKEKAKKVLTENNIPPKNPQSRQQAEKTFEMYMAELYKTMPKRIKLIKK